MLKNVLDLACGKRPSLKTDILCVQETHFAQGKAASCHHRLFPHQYFANNIKNIRGVMIAVRGSIFFQPQHTESDPMGRYLILSSLFDNVPYAIVIYMLQIHIKSDFKI